MLKAIIFDFDGIIVDSEPLHYRALLELAREFGHSFDYEFYLTRYIGFDDRGSFEAMLTDAGKHDRAVDQKYISDLCARKQDAFIQVVEAGVQAYPGLHEFIDQLHKALPIAIASGATREDIELILRKLDLRDRFDVIITADDVQRSKPDPTTYRVAWQRLSQKHSELKIAPEECLAIEDTAAGIESARGAGLQTLGVTTTGTAAKLARAHRVVEKLQGITLWQLHQWFD